MLKPPLDLKLLESLCNGFGPSGFEDEIQTYVKKYVSSFADEIGKIVSSIENNAINAIVSGG